MLRGDAKWQPHVFSDDLLLDFAEDIDLEGPREVVAGAVLQRGIDDEGVIARRPRPLGAELPAALFVGDA